LIGTIARPNCRGYGNDDAFVTAYAYDGNLNDVELLLLRCMRPQLAIAPGGVHLIAARVDYTENIRVLVDELSGQTGA
jgi:hypothetical protein